jgi:hypothetical protein
MATTAQKLANQANAQKSTGPRTAAGKLNSSLNAKSHGLHCEPSNLFAQNEAIRAQYNELREKLFDQCAPQGEMELQTFERYAYALFQLHRARTFEIDAQLRFQNEPDSGKWFKQMERMAKLAAQFERRADKALQELRLLQMDRVSATDIQAEFYARKKNFPIPASLPIAKMRSMSINGTPRAAMTLMVGHSQPRYQKVFKDLIPLKELKRTNPI